MRPSTSLDRVPIDWRTLFRCPESVQDSELRRRGSSVNTSSAISGPGSPQFGFHQDFEDRPMEIYRGTCRVLGIGNAFSPSVMKRSGFWQAAAPILLPACTSAHAPHAHSSARNQPHGGKTFSNWRHLSTATSRFGYGLVLDRD